MLSERLRRAREAAGISCRELDRLAGITPGHSWSLERGARATPTSATASALARALGVSLDWLIDGQGAEPTVEQITAAVTTARETVAASA